MNFRQTGLGAMLSHSTIIFIVLLAGTIQAQQAVSQPPVPAGAEQRKITVDEVRSKRSVVESAADLDETVRKNALSLLDQAIGFQELATEYSKEAEAIRQRIKSASGRLKQIKSQLEKPFESPETINALAAKMTLDKLQQRTSEEELKLQAAKKDLVDRNEQFNQQNRLLKQAPESIAKLKQRLKELQEKLNKPPAAVDPAVIVESRRLAALSEQDMTRSELTMYELLLSGQDVIYSPLIAVRDLAAREAMRQEAATRAWQLQLQARRQEEAAQAREQAEEAKSKIQVMPLLLQEQFDINIALSAQLEELSREEVDLARELNSLQARLNSIDDEYNLAREKVDLIVLTDAIGLALREQRRALPSVDRFRRDSAQRKLRMSQIQERQIELDRQKKALADLDAAVDKVAGSITYLGDTPAEKARFKSEVRALFNNRRELIEMLLTGYQRSFNSLRKIEVTEQQLVDKAEEFADFLDRHLLWIRSSKPISLADMPFVLSVLREFARFDNWKRFFRDVSVSFRQSPLLWVLVLLLGALLVAGRKPARRHLAAVAEKVNRQQEESFLLTLRAVVITLWLAVSWPLLIGLPAYLLSRDWMQHPFTYPVASGLFNAAAIWVILGFIYQVCRSNGLAQVHFAWDEPLRRTLRSNLKWFIPLSVSMNFFIAGTIRTHNLAYGDPTARLALIIISLGFLVFIMRILSFSGEFVSTLVTKRPQSLLVRLRYFWYPLAIAAPLAQIVLASTRYFHSALEIRNLMGITVVLLVLLAILHALALRWLTLVRRKIALREAMAQAVPEQAPGDRVPQTETLPDGSDVFPSSENIPGKTLQQIDEQSRKSLKAVFYIFAILGLWWIWEPLFPAFGVFEDIQLWSYSLAVGDKVEAVPITLADLLMAVFLAAATVFAARNLPGFLEVTLLSRFAIDYGARHAYATLTRYAIFAAGIFIAFSIIGIKWSTIQWLVAALSVGLGFGLQEIVANFISGLIVLFERPFRVGDTVTVGDVSGTVSRIRIRATTIVDWDRKELIVPNKDFITGRLINWSLSDSIVRLKIPVGIAYGSDTDLAEKILMKAARENKLVLSDPAPSAVFTGFGDNSLNFLLRVFINNIEHWFTVTHQLHRVIDREFRKAGISIAFPQRDVHLDTAGPFEVRIVPSEGQL